MNGTRETWLFGKKYLWSHEPKGWTLQRMEDVAEVPGWENLTADEIMAELRKAVGR